MKIFRLTIAVLSAVTFSTFVATAVNAEEKKASTECFESREVYSAVTQREIEPGWPNVKCSPTTGATLWWGDPFDGTVPMGEMPVEADYSHEEAVVKPREAQIDRNKLFTICSMACHNDNYVKPPKDINPRAIPMHKDIVPDSMQLKHGRGAIWCLNCHSPTN
ncbi:MAG: hypothetical protein GY731_11920, partial [Gammaproteobacteria bacterium]|nr:hypothetical protein [Gammaproteobacteria bacterium]